MINKISSLILFLLLTATASLGQSSADKIPLDNRIATGQLPNGLKYFIMHNEKPEDKVEMRLVINAGSVLENDDQQGLAHFLEHMAFNGSEHFKKNELVDYLQTAGVKFGAHLNAYTSFDETVYMLSLPTEDKEVLSKGYQILEDWAGHLLLDSQEIEKERGVVLEEYRLGLGASKRMLAEYMPKMMYNSKYAERLPIGKKNILETFKRETIKSFYDNWYRPNLMAVVIVGDIDVEAAKAEVVKHFSGLKNPKNPIPRTNIDAPDHDETFVSTVTDAEATYGIVQIMYKKDGLNIPKSTLDEFRGGIRKQIFFEMLNERIQDLTKKPEAAFAYGGVYEGGMWARYKEALQGSAVVSEGQYLTALEQLLTEMIRAQKYGFSEQAFERAKSNLKVRFEKAVKEQDKTESRSYAGQLVSHFLENESLPNPKWSLDQYNSYVDKISLEELNHHLDDLMRDRNRVIVMTGPETDKEKMPSESEVKNLVNAIAQKDIPPLQEEEIPSQLITDILGTSPIIKEETNEALNIHTFTLANGIKVISKPTKLKNDQILFRAFSEGGSNMMDDDHYKKVNLGLSSISQTGVGEFSESALEKVLAGKSVSVSPYISSTTEGFSGNSRPQDLETMMQLVYLYFKNPRWDEEAFNNFVMRQRSIYDNMASNPSSYFSVEWGKFLTDNHPRSFSVPTTQDWKETEYPMLRQVYNERFNNAADFTFTFTGNVEIDELKTLCSKYLGSLSTSKEREKTINIGNSVKPGTDKLVVKKGSDPKSRVSILIHKKTPYTRKKDLTLDLTAEILTIKMIEVLREEMGGVYGTSANCYFSRIPDESFNFGIGFPCGPENVDTLIQAAFAQLNLLGTNGPSDKDLNKVKETMIKTLQTDVQSNQYWLNQLYGMAMYNETPQTYEERVAGIKAITKTDIQKAVKDHLQGDHLVGVLMPEE